MNSKLPHTNVILETENSFIQKLYDTCEEKEKDNVVCYWGKQLLKEGSVYKNIWLETQPMGADMYAKRNMEVALNNQLIFMENQREDGRIPGMIKNNNNSMELSFDFCQGYCFPTPALHVYYMMKKDSNYLKKLYVCLEKFDAYLWKYRDSNKDGCLETWCEWDTGEDNCIRLSGAPHSWEGEEPPKGIGMVPYASMDFMGYSAEGRRTLAKIAKILENGREAFWQQKTQEVIDKIRSYLWIEEKNACFDRDCNNLFMDILLHNNLRVMYYGGFTQDMADRFIRHHLLNPEEFWTKLPLPSIAANDKYYRNDSDNNWSGQPQGLTYQRAIQALENYGHFAEVALLGKKFIDVLGRALHFPQQFDPFMAVPSTDRDGYGPTILAVLEYISMLYGVSIGCDEILFSGLCEQNRSYTQQWDGDDYTLIGNEHTFSGYINGDNIFSCTTGVRIVTDLSGAIKNIIGLDEKTNHITLQYNGNETLFSVAPNEVFELHNGRPVRIKKVPFDYCVTKKTTKVK